MRRDTQSRWGVYWEQRSMLLNWDWSFSLSEAAGQPDTIITIVTVTTATLQHTGRFVTAFSIFFFFYSLTVCKAEQTRYGAGGSAAVQNASSKNTKSDRVCYRMKHADWAALCCCRTASEDPEKRSRNPLWPQTPQTRAPHQIQSQTAHGSRDQDSGRDRKKASCEKQNESSNMNIRLKISIQSQETGNMRVTRTR